jgi:hypothetical protein
MTLDAIDFPTTYLERIVGWKMNVEEIYSS